MPIELDRRQIDAVIDAVVDRLDGDWLLIGGALVALWLSPRRVTEDVDLIGIEDTGADRLALLGLADDLGLPVEAVNSAADFFVHRIPGWRQEIELYRKGIRARVFRPSPTLFLLLKIARLSDRDLDDCRALLTHAAAENLAIDAPRVAGALDGLPATQDPTVLERRSRLRGELSRIST